MNLKAVIFSIVLIFVLSSPLQAQVSPNIFVPLPDGLAVTIGIEATAGRAFVARHDGAALVWRNDKYEVRITTGLQEGFRTLRVQALSLSGQPLPIRRLSARVKFPAAGVDGIWTPAGVAQKDLLISSSVDQPFITHSNANYGIPYVAAATAPGANVMALGFLRQDLPVEIRGRRSTNSYELAVRADFPMNRLAYDEQFFLSNDPSLTWFDAAQLYADWVDNSTAYVPFPVSERAYEPVYDTWYWSKDQVDHYLYIDTAAAAATAGLGMFLADSGWDAATGEYDRWLNGSTGDYTPPPDKFWNLSETFNFIRSELKLKVQLWLQPFAVGRTSLRYPQTAPLHTHILKSANSQALAPFTLPVTAATMEDVNLCPRLISTHRYLRSLFIEMARSYRPEGYWLDFIDGIHSQCIAQHQHDYDSFGAGFREALRTIRRTILSFDRQAVVHFRAPYANLNNKPFANVWQPFDAPHEPERMRLDALRLRPFSRGVVFAADQLYWPSTADEETVARSAMTSVMTGVPSIGANLLDSPAGSVEIVKSWIGFYRTYQSDFASGRVRPFGAFRSPDHSIETEARLFAYIRSNGTVAFTVGEQSDIFLMNASPRRRMQAVITVPSERSYTAMTFDKFLRRRGGTMAVTSIGTTLRVNFFVEPGGMVLLRARS
jgi:hypothetical protein